MQWIGRRPWRASAVSFVSGLLGTTVAVLLLGEGYARFAPPNDFRHYVEGDAKNAIYRADPVLGADYRSYQDFAAENARRLGELGPLDLPKPTWLFLGNSFVQAPGMLADSASQALPTKRIFSLGRNVDLPLRVAQARLLLRAGLRPERILFVLLPLDVWQIGPRPLSYIVVTAEGRIAARIRWPAPPWGKFIRASALATIAWVRGGWAAGDPAARIALIDQTPAPRMQSDLRKLLGALADVAREFTAPTTVVAVPDREQVFGKSGFGLQAALRAICAQAGLDFYDARLPFIQATDKPSLFLPDWHFSARGNALLLKGLFDHLDRTGAPAPEQMGDDDRR
jgi:hypothetical protein